MINDHTYSLVDFDIIEAERGRWRNKIYKSARAIVYHVDDDDDGDDQLLHDILQ